MDSLVHDERTARVECPVVVDPGLTVKQLEVLTVLARGGYWERPREITQREAADRLGIHPGTVTKHVAWGMNKLVPAYIDAVQGNREPGPFAHPPDDPLRELAEQLGVTVEEQDEIAAARERARPSFPTGGDP